jgi:hypothetical protein
LLFLALSRPDAVLFPAPPLPGVRFLSRSHALSARRLFSFALSRTDAVRFLAPLAPNVCFFLARSRARALASSARRALSLTLSRAPLTLFAFSHVFFACLLPTNPATFAFSRTLAPLRPPFAFSPARLCSCSKTGRLRAHILLVLVRVLVLVLVRVRVLCEYVTSAVASARVL